MTEDGAEAERVEDGHPTGGFLPAVKIVAYFIAILVAAGIASVFVAPIIAVGIRGSGGIIAISDLPLWVLTVSELAIAAAIVGVTLAFVVYWDRRPAYTLGVCRRGSWVADLGVGLGLGLALPFLVFLISYLAGWIQITGSLFAKPATTWVPALLWTLIFFTAIAVSEEFLARGYLLQTLWRGYGVIPALILSSIIFGFLHFMNPGASFPGFLGTTAAGIVLGMGYIVTGRLWLPIAFHFGWNMALGPIFGFPVSGVELPAWISQNVHGPAFWTGGAFGPEAGMLALLMLLVGAGVIRLYSGRARPLRDACDEGAVPR